AVSIRILFFTICQASCRNSLSRIFRNARIGKVALRGNADGGYSRKHSDFNGYLGGAKSTLPEMKYLGLIWRVLRRLVWETAMDNTTGLAAQMAYLLLFALAPGSLFLWH